MMNLEKINSKHIQKCFILDSTTLKMWTIDQWKEEIENPNNFAFGIFNNNNLIGLCVHQKILNEVEVHFLTVHREYRRRGFAKKLIRNIIVMCERNRIDRIILEVSKKNQPAIQFYKTFGFRTIGLRRKFCPSL